MQISDAPAWRWFHLKLWKFDKWLKFGQNMSTTLAITAFFLWTCSVLGINCTHAKESKQFKPVVSASLGLWWRSMGGAFQNVWLIFQGKLYMKNASFTIFFSCPIESLKGSTSLGFLQSPKVMNAFNCLHAPAMLPAHRPLWPSARPFALHRPRHTQAANTSAKCGVKP